MKTKLILSLLVIAGLCFVSCSDDDENVINKDDGTSQNPDGDTGDEGTGDESTGDESTGGDEDTPGEGSGTYLVPDATDPDTQVTFTVLPYVHRNLPGSGGYDFTGDYRLYSATVTINGEKLASVKVDPGTTVSYEVECAGYETQSGTQTVSKDTEQKVVLTGEATSGNAAFDVSTNEKLSGHLSAALYNNTIDYVRTDCPVTFEITYQDEENVTLVCTSPRWGTLKHTNMKVEENSDKSVFSIPFTFSSEDVQQFHSPYVAESPNFPDDNTGLYPIIDYSGKITKDYDFELLIFVQALCGGTYFNLVSGEATGAEMVAGHYVGEIECSGIVNGKTKEQGKLGLAGNGNHTGETWALLKEDPNGKLYFDLMGFDLDGYSFGDIVLSGIDFGSYSSTNAYSSGGAVPFSTTTQCINPDGKQGYVTIEGTIELEVDSQGILGVEILSEVITSTGSDELNIVFIAEWTNWCSDWNGSYAIAD